jgi:cytochrome c553
MRFATRQWLAPLLALCALGALRDARAGDAAAGRARVQALCQICHGMDGKAIVAGAANLSGQQKEYLEAQLKAFRSGARRHEQMNIIAKPLTDPDIENLAAWYSGIKVTVEMPK